jgi:hypothetical protein
MPTPATTIPALTGDQLAQRLVALFPQSWVSDAEKAPGGILYGLAGSVGDALAKLLGQVAYAQKTTRLATAQDVALDTWSSDLFGTSLPRQPGEPDQFFRTRLQLAVLRPALTRAALVSALTSLTGYTPRVSEPWQPGDTSAYDFRSFWDYEGAVMPNGTIANPSRVGTPELRYQGFVEVVRPVTAQAGQGQLYGWDLGWAWDSVYGWRDPDTSWQLGDQLVYTVINAIRPYGTIVWVKFVSPTALTASPGPLSMDFLGAL